MSCIVNLTKKGGGGEYASIEMDPTFFTMCCYLGVYVFSFWGKIGVSFCVINNSYASYLSQHVKTHMHDTKDTL